MVGMEFSGYAPPMQQLLGMLQTQPFFPGLSPLHPAFYQAASSLQQAHTQGGGSVIPPPNVSPEAAQIIHQRLVASMCNVHPSARQTSSGVLGSMLNLPPRDMGLSGSFTIDAILGNKENQQNGMVARESGDTQQAVGEGKMREDMSDHQDSATTYSKTEARVLDEGPQTARIFQQDTQYSIMGKDSFEERRRRFFTEKNFQQRCHQHTSKQYDSGHLSINAFPEQRGVGKNKRVRTIFTPEQLERLEAVFQKQQYMVGTERYYLAASLHLSEAQVKVWFQNRRIKWRKHQFEEQHQLLHAQQRSLLGDEDENEALRFPRSYEDNHLDCETGSGDLEMLSDVPESCLGIGNVVDLADSEVNVQEDGVPGGCVNEGVHRQQGEQHSKDQNKEDLQLAVREQYKPCDTRNEMDKNDQNTQKESLRLGVGNTSDTSPCDCHLDAPECVYSRDDSGAVLDFTMGSKQIW